MMLVRALVEDERAWAAALVTEHFGSPTVVSRGALHDTRSLPGFVALGAGERCGLLQYRADGGDLEIVVVIARHPRRGIGRRLLLAVEEVARAQGCRRLWLVTTNYNAPALAFYRAIGWRQCAVRRGAIEEARRLKPQIPLTGHGGRSDSGRDRVRALDRPAAPCHGLTRREDSWSRSLLLPGQ